MYWNCEFPKVIQFSKAYTLAHIVPQQLVFPSCLPTKHFLGIHLSLQSMMSKYISRGFHLVVNMLSYVYQIEFESCKAES